jgi:hypothetical protein
MTDLLTTLVQKLDERTATFTDLDSASHKKRTPNRSLSERNGSLKPTPSERFEAESAHSVNVRSVNPFYLFCTRSVRTGTPPTYRT